MTYALLIYGNGARAEYDRLPETLGGEQLTPEAKAVQDGLEVRPLVEVER